MGGFLIDKMWKYRTAASDRYQILKEFSRENRKNQTMAEKVLWDYIRGNALGTKALRQHIIGDYIVDFIFPYCNLIIEVDGGYHAEREQHDDDLLRSEILNRMGYYVTRFTNEQVLYDTTATIDKIKELINNIKAPQPSMESKHITPSPF